MKYKYFIYHNNYVFQNISAVLYAFDLIEHVTINRPCKFCKLIIDDEIEAARRLSGNHTAANKPKPKV